ncbi:hypothetical protein BGZ65_012699 [Modicella reniformis]|uniref:F-box domain-containing protein n=1 Tax=Modicella reniformis TaxID=1440133 RepID=A0A9P6MJK0_9FUNG|nr:hypothetical protein BGZ65_012699 [Modicella reniformis]
MNQPPNPLDIPEILSRVGLFVPLWVYSDQNSGPNNNNRSRNRRPRFNPQHLLNCILVNRTWHHIFLPILWFTFDDISIPPSVFHPVKILIRHSRHLRIFELNHSSTAAIVTVIPRRLLPHNLLHLGLSGHKNHDWAKALMLQNTRLESLYWQGTSSGGDYHHREDEYETLDAKALSKRLRRLQDLHLEYWKLDSNFMKLLRRNPGLRRLELHFVTGELHHHQSQAARLDDQMNREAAIENDSDDDDDDDDEDDDEEEDEQGEQGKDDTDDDDSKVQLPYLTSLTVCKDIGSGALEELVRSCPRLEELSWMGSVDSDLKQLARNLQECCPGLSILTYSTVEVHQDESVYATLIQVIPRLAELQIRIPALGNRFTEALIKHASTLEILDLRILNPHENTHTNLRRILTSCHQITALSIDGWSRSDTDLFSFKWACLRLTRLFLQGLHDALTREGGQMTEADDNATVAAVYGWTATVLETDAAGSSGYIEEIGGEGQGGDETGTEDAAAEMIVRPYGGGAAHNNKVSTGFLNKLLSHLQTMKHLQSFMLNGVEYTRRPPFVYNTVNSQ